MERIAGYDVHPLASFWPLPTGEKLAEFEDDIFDKGVLHPIVVDKNTRLLVDGRSRGKAWETSAADNPSWGQSHPLPVQEMEFEDDSAVFVYILSVNRNRRHITDTQIALIGTRMHELLAKIISESEAAKAEGQFKKGDKRQNPGGKTKAVVSMDSSTPQEKPKGYTKERDARSTVGKLQKLLGVSFDKAGKAISIRRGPIRLYDLAIAGDLSMTAAANIAKFPELWPELDVTAHKVLAAKAARLKETQKVSRNKTDEVPVEDSDQDKAVNDAVQTNARPVEDCSENRCPTCGVLEAPKRIMPRDRNLERVDQWLRSTATMKEVGSVYDICADVLGLKGRSE